MLHFIYQYYFILIVFFFPVHFHLLGQNSVHRLPHIIGLHRQLPAEAAVNKYHQLYFAWAAKVNERVHGRAYGAPGMQHIIYQYHVLVLYAERNVGVRGYLDVVLMHIIPVEGNIKLAIFDPAVAGDLFHQRSYPVRQKYATWLDAYNDRVCKRKMIFDQLVC